MAEQREMMRKTDEATENLRAKFLGTESPSRGHNHSRVTKTRTRSTIMAILPPDPPGTPSPFDGNLIIFGVGPRASSTKPSQSVSAEPGSASVMTEEEMAEQREMMRKTDEAMSRYKFRSTGKPSTGAKPSSRCYNNKE